MLAKTPQLLSFENKVDFSELLKIPLKPDSLVRAETVWREATAAREAAQKAHIEGIQKLRAQVPGQPLTISTMEVDEMGARLAPCFEVERQALSVRDVEHSKYDEAVRVRLFTGLETLRSAIAETTETLDELFGHGIRAHAASIAAGVRPPNNVAVRCRDLRSQISFIRMTFRSST